VKNFPSTLRFVYTWRDYQARALEEMAAHLEDARLHVVAPPGSGKTVLGLEFMRRLDRPALIVAPTRTIQAQWVQRFRENFGAGNAEWISLDLRKPALMTVTTYQMMHQVSEGDELGGVLARLKEIGLQTLILDEAHHLKQAWWQAIIHLRDHFEGMHTISLTATPPYDSIDSEWERYTELCGEIDMEIPVPELVLNGDLCPHLDLIYFDFASAEDLEQRVTFQRQIVELVEALKHWELLLEQLLQHPWIVAPEDYEADIYGEVAWFSSVLVFLQSTGLELNPKLLELLDADVLDLPRLNVEWAQVLLRGILSKKQCEAFSDDFLNELKLMLKKHGAFERKLVQLLSSYSRNRRLMRSASKLRSIEAIVRVEQRSHGEDLRLLVLSDYIYPEFLGAGGEASQHAKSLKLGAVPIFEKLREAGVKRVGLLTGSLVIIPVSAVNTLEEVCGELLVPSSGIRLKAIERLPGYVEVSFAASAGVGIVRVITETFARGAIHVLSGTQALLGEGWDAPCINSLIVASNIGSFVSSNQIRGRAIRTDPQWPEKVSKIWHLVTLTGVPNDEPDFDCIRRRLKTFVGPNHKEHAIQSGLDRLGLPASILTREQCGQVNSDMEALAGDFEWIRNCWSGAADDPNWQGLFYQITRISGNKLTQFAYLWKTVEAAFYAVGMAVLCVAFELFQQLAAGGRGLVLWVFLLVSAAIGLWRIAAELWRAIRLYRKYGLTGVTADRVGRSLFRAMQALGKFDHDISGQDLRVEKFMGNVAVSLKGGNRMDRHHFASAFLEMMGPITSPRHLLSHVSGGRKSYFPVPEFLFVTDAERGELLRQMQKLMGRTQLVNCRTHAGRRVLLQARSCSLFNEWDDAGETLSRWE
jgi:superfamily II DNA or RNA helicase